MKGLDESFGLDVNVKVVEQVDVRQLNGSYEPLFLDGDVNSESCCHKDVTGLTDAADMQQVWLNGDGLDELFCLVDNVLVVEQDDV